MGEAAHQKTLSEFALRPMIEKTAGVCRRATMTLRCTGLMR
jgi:hypothetical protein